MAYPTVQVRTISDLFIISHIYVKYYFFLYRLKVLPKLYYDNKFKCNVNLIGRWMFCQVGLGSILFLWALAGATAFRYTEGTYFIAKFSYRVSKCANLKLK